jgi:Mpv17 / PMP22 family
MQWRHYGRPCRRDCRSPAVPTRTAISNDHDVPIIAGSVFTRRRFKSTNTQISSPGNSSSSSSSSFGARLWQLYARNLEARPLVTKCTLSSLIFFASDSVTQYILPPTPLEEEEEEEEEREQERKQKTMKHDDDGSDHGDGDGDDTAIHQLETTTNTALTGGSSFWLVQRWDAPRALSAAAFGALASCYLHHWWNLLEFVLGRAIPIQRYGRLAHTAVKVVIDQGMGKCILLHKHDLCYIQTLSLLWFKKCKKLALTNDAVSFFFSHASIRACDTTAAPCYVYSYYTLTNFFHDLQEGKKDAATSWKETNAKASEMLWPTMMQHWKLWPLVHSFNFYYAPLHHRVLVQNCVLVGWSGYLSHLNHGSSAPINHHQKLLVTPDDEIKATILRRQTEKRMQQTELQNSTP